MAKRFCRGSFAKRLGSKVIRVIRIERESKMPKKILIFSSLIAITFGCLITNCPRGGKRSEAGSVSYATRECPACGTNRLGQCFGPYICCGPSIGCFIGTPETHSCHQESLFSRPCIAGFAACRGDSARCAADGICCSQESCYVDAACQISASGGAALRPRSSQIGAQLGAILADNNNDASNEMMIR